MDITGILTHKVTCIYPDKVLDYERRRKYGTFKDYIMKGKKDNVRS